MKTLAADPHFELRVFILYGAASTGDRAFKLCLRLQQSLGGESFQSTLCKIDLLADPMLADDALELASEADVLIVCAGSGAPLSGEVVPWLERLPAHRGYNHPAMIVVTDDTSGQNAETHQLRGLAQRKGFDFLMEAEPEGAQSHTVSHATLRVQQGLLAQHETGYLHWGINE